MAVKRKDVNDGGSSRRTTTTAKSTRTATPRTGMVTATPRTGMVTATPRTINAAKTGGNVIEKRSKASTAKTFSNTNYYSANGKTYSAPVNGRRGVTNNKNARKY